MHALVPAVFEGGLFRPVAPVKLAEGSVVEVVVPISSPLDHTAATMVATPSAIGSPDETTVDAAPGGDFGRVSIAEWL